MKKIVRGNDFTLRIPVRKMVNGEQVAFPLPACTDIQVNIVNQYRRVSLAYSIDTAEDNIILARVEGDAVSVGTYALEVRGKIFGNDWRSKEYEQFAIVDNNASGEENISIWMKGMSFTMPCAQAEMLMRSIENYAYECFNVTAAHKKAVSELNSIQEVEKYDITAGYPAQLKMEV